MRGGSISHVGFWKAEVSFLSGVKRIAQPDLTVEIEVMAVIPTERAKL
ncbi:MAG: hypothetical protein HYT78_12715 [Deltaproteobacteria bacterium]|nr:hypothetical protein [Deltaproteobacteria bacterium]